MKQGREGINMKSMGRMLMVFLLSFMLLLPLCATGEEEGRVVLLEANMTQLSTGDDCWLHCYAPDADEAILYRSDEKAQNAIHEQWPMGVNFDSYVFTQEASVMTFRLSARFGEEWVDSAPVQITVTAPNGPFPTPIIHVASAVKLGQDVTFTLKTVEDAIVYNVVVQDDQGREVMFFDRQQEVYTIPAQKLTNGKYRISANAWCPGYSGIGEAAASFAVGMTGRTVTLTSDRSAYQTNEPFLLKLYAPEAEEVVLYRYGEEWMRWEHGMNETIPVFWPDETMIAFQLRALYGDEWVESAELRLQITAPNGDTPPFHVSVRDIYPENQAVTFALSPIANVTEFSLRVFTALGDEVFATTTWQESITIPADRLTRGYYHLNAYVKAQGYLFDSMVDLNFHVGEIDRTVTLTLDHTPILMFEKFSLSCFAPEAQEAILYEVPSDSGSLYEARHWYGRVDETISYDGFNNPDYALGFVFTARFGETWKEVGVIAAPTAPYGEKPPLTIQTQDSYNPDQDIVIRFDTEATLAECYINVLDTAGQWLRGMEGYDAEKREYRIPAGELTLGRYQIEIMAFAVGYATSNTVTADFLVGESSRTLYVEVTPPSPVTGDGYDVRIVAPYADEILLYRQDGDKEEYVFYNWNTGLIRTLGAMSFGDLKSVYRLTARFGDEWVEAPLVTVPMQAPKGKMPDPVIHAQKQYPEGQDVRFTVETVDEPIIFELAVLNEKQEVIYSTGYLYDREFGIAAEAMPKGTYTIKLDVEGKGYAGMGHALFSFQVVDAAAPTPGPSDDPAQPRYTVSANFDAENLLLTGSTAHMEGTAESKALFARITYFMANGNYTVVSAPVFDDGTFESMFSGNVVHIAVQAVNSPKIRPGTYTRYGGYELNVE